MENETSTSRVDLSELESNNQWQKNKNIYIAGAIIAGLILGGGFWYWQTQLSGGTDLEEEMGVEGEPADAVLDFYGDLRRALRDAPGDPFVFERDNSVELSPEMLERFNGWLSESRVAVLDNMFCQPSVPERLRTKRTYVLEDEVQFLITARDEGLYGQAVATLQPVDGRWKITDVRCEGETAPDREFSFQEPGYLIKNVPAPLDSQYWHIVFSQGGQLGHTVPLFFNESSTCIAADGTESVCAPDSFVETSKAIVAGEMSETGLTVQRLEFLE